MTTATKPTIRMIMKQGFNCVELFITTHLLLSFQQYSGGRSSASCKSFDFLVNYKKKIFLVREASGFETLDFIYQPVHVTGGEAAAKMQSCWWGAVLCHPQTLPLLLSLCWFLLLTRSRRADGFTHKSY